MKFLLAMLSRMGRIVALVFFTQCATTLPVLKSKSIVPLSDSIEEQNINESLSKADLDLLEFKDPSNADIKLQLARFHWCLEARGLAVENWLWVDQFSPNSPEAEKARLNLSLSKNDPEQLYHALKCHR